MAGVLLTLYQGYFSTRIVYPDPNLKIYLFLVINIVVQFKKKPHEHSVINFASAPPAQPMNNDQALTRVDVKTYLKGCGRAC